MTRIKINLSKRASFAVVSKGQIMRAIKLYAVLAASSAASFAAFTATAQERISTPEADAFVAHPTHCSQWIGGPDNEVDGVPEPMATDFFKALVSLNSPDFKLPMQPLDLITDMCKEKLVSKSLAQHPAERAKSGSF